jgi:hypothetical protein
MSPDDLIPFRFTEDELGRNLFAFLDEVTATAGTKPPLDWAVRLHAKTYSFFPKASSLSAALGFIALSQRDNYPQEMMGAFDITSAAIEILNAETPHEIAHRAAELELAKRRILFKSDRARYKP